MPCSNWHHHYCFYLCSELWYTLLQSDFQSGSECLHHVHFQCIKHLTKMLCSDSRNRKWMCILPRHAGHTIMTVHSLWFWLQLRPNCIGKEWHILHVVSSVAHHQVTPRHSNERFQATRTPTPQPTKNWVSCVAWVVPYTVKSRINFHPFGHHG